MTDTTKKIIYSAIGAALVAVLTMFPSIPIPAGGYVHLGDAIILVFAVLIGEYAIISAAVGAGLADILLGSAVYAPATVIIKALVALIVCLFLKRKQFDTIRFVIGSVVAEAVMVAGYFLYELIIYGGAAAAAAGIVWNVCQGVFSIALGVIVILVLRKTGLYEKLGINKKQS